MRELKLRHPDISKEKLLELAENIPGAWMGIRVAGYLLMVSGWPASKVATLFGISRVNTSKWCHKANKEGLEAVYDKRRSGRPTQFDDETMKLLNLALAESPKKYGIERNRWDGRVVAEYLHKHHGITIHIRHAQRLIHKLGFSLRQPIYRFAQAGKEGVAEHIRTLKKTPVRSSSNIQKGNSVR